jgi:DNA-nicking Smr family endonuclease
MDDSFAGLDKRNAQRLKRGQMKIEARLDLHGMAQVEAHRSLREFVPRSVDAGKRCVLVITGKGSPRDRDDIDGAGGIMPDRDVGVLRTEVPKWLGGVDLRPHIIRFEVAIPKHGGAGALYVLLRRRRTNK